MSPDIRLHTPVGDVASALAPPLSDRGAARCTISRVASCNRSEVSHYEAACYALIWQVSLPAGADELGIGFVLTGEFSDHDPEWESGENRVGLKWQSETSELKLWTHDEEWLADRYPNIVGGTGDRFRLVPRRGGFSAVMAVSGWRGGDLSLTFALAWSQTDPLTAAMTSVADWSVYSGHGAYNQQLHDILFKT